MRQRFLKNLRADLKALVGPQTLYFVRGVHAVADLPVAWRAPAKNFAKNFQALGQGRKIVPACRRIRHRHAIEAYAAMAAIIPSIASLRAHTLNLVSSDSTFGGNTGCVLGIIGRQGRGRNICNEFCSHSCLRKAAQLTFERFDIGSSQFSDSFRQFGKAY